MVQASTHIFGNAFKIVLMAIGSLLLIALVVSVIGIFPTPMLGVLALVGVGLALLPVFLRGR